MSERGYFAYIRVSTTRQGEEGASLEAQKRAIQRYAACNDFTIAEWFEEQVTAAKRGRPVFKAMMKRLKAGEARGILVHKIDRSARNLHDWAAFVDLADQDIEIHLCHEQLDLTSRNGRLSADIQAVVAADTVRNLREESRKGMYTRLEQGLWPWAAPVGYLNQGGGKGKLGEENSALFGSLLVSGFVSRAYSRTRDSAPFFLYLDEFQNFVSLSLVNALSELRKFRLGLVLAHQYLSQLSEEIRSSVLGNVGSTLLFRVGARDARFLTSEVEPEFSALDLRRLPNFEAVVKLMVQGETSGAFSVEMVKPET